MYSVIKSAFSAVRNFNMIVNSLTQMTHNQVGK